MEKQGLTPMMRQYLDIKGQNEDFVLMYRLGDFYEMFFDDAQRVSQELDLTLTGRDCGLSERAPMCGVPYHSAESYIARLIAKGYKVAICEQTEDPATAKGLVRREVVRKITPGTVIESSMLDERANNFIGAVYIDTRGAGLCFCDISTGEAHATQIDGDCLDEVLAECARFGPSELILSDAAFGCERLISLAQSRLNCHVERGGERRFDFESALQGTRTQFGISDDFSAGISDKPLLVQAVGGLLSYLLDTQMNAQAHLNPLAHINRLNIYTGDEYMALDMTARKNLEITQSAQTGDKKGSLLWVLDHTKTAMGARALRRWLERPLLSQARIQDRLNAVNALVSDISRRGELESALSKMGDLERIIGRIVYGSANCRDLLALKAVCGLLPEVKRAAGALEPRLLKQLAAQIDLLEDIYAQIDSAIDENEPPFSVREGNMIKPGYSADVDGLRALLSGGTQRMAAIEARERERTGIAKLKVGYNRVFGYYLEVSRAQSAQMPDNYIRKQTLANAERYITPELKELEGEVLAAGERLNALEYELFTSIRERVALEAHRVQQTARAIAELDSLQSFAKAAALYGYAMPEIDSGDVLDIRDGRHPVVERVVPGGAFVPNDACLDCGENRVFVITGPNMAGKSTFMRQVALIALMAQCGSFVPAKSARVGLVDRIFTRVGASDDMLTGRSTFMVEMSEVAEILKNATRKSLLILDEIGRGTSTFDGMSIARAVLEYAASRKTLGAKTLFATHYHELCELEGAVEGVKNFNVVVKKRGDDIIFIKKVVRGGTGDSYGIDVARLAGVPEPVIRRAKEVLTEIESRAPLALNAIAQPVPPAVPEDQMTMGGFASSEIVERLRMIEPNTFTPIEALQALYELCARAKEC